MYESTIVFRSAAPAVFVSLQCLAAATLTLALILAVVTVLTSRSAAVRHRLLTLGMATTLLVPPVIVFAPCVLPTSIVSVSDPIALMSQDIVPAGEVSGQPAEGKAGQRASNEGSGSGAGWIQRAGTYRHATSVRLCVSGHLDRRNSATHLFAGQKSNLPRPNQKQLGLCLGHLYAHHRAKTCRGTGHPPEIGFALQSGDSSPHDRGIAAPRYLPSYRLWKVES